MRRAHRLPPELQHLAIIAGDRSAQYREAMFLKSPFEADSWDLFFGNPTYSRTLSFAIELEDKSLLTHKRNSELLETFKSWICIQGHFDTTGGRILAPITASHKVSRTLILIDYFLLHKSQFKLGRYGLKTVTENDLLGLIADLCSSHRAAHGIYRWPERLTDYLRRQIAFADKEALLHEIHRHPALAEELPHVDQRMLALSDDEIVYARAWLRLNNIYKGGTSHDYSLAPSTYKLAQLIYKDTLAGKSSKPIPKELLVSPLERYLREYPAVAVHMSKGKTLGKVEWYKYRRALFSLGLLADIGLPVPVEPLRRLSRRSISELMQLRPIGRYRSLPKSVVFPALRNSIEFVLEYGDDIVDSAIAVITHAKKLRVKSLLDPRMDNISALITPKLNSIGVRTWSLNTRMRFIEPGPHRAEAKKRYSRRAEFHKRMRANEGLWELIQVLFGSVQICLGALSARRMGELADLVVGQCVDPSSRQLVFKNRKTGALAKREEILRPIPRIALRLIKLLERLHRGTNRTGRPSQLLAAPNGRSGEPTRLPAAQYFDQLDRFCDYFELPVTQDGFRYYIRQHQLRRFFALAFFWGSSFGGVETLRWYLGHVDAEQLYNYITEMITGEALRNVKAGYAAECAIAGRKEASALADLLEQRYGTREFAVLDQDELETYVDDLLLRGTVTVEPEFIDIPKGESYRILIKVDKKEPHNAVGPAR